MGSGLTISQLDNGTTHARGNELVDVHSVTVTVYLISDTTIMPNPRKTYGNTVCKALNIGFAPIAARRKGTC